MFEALFILTTLDAGTRVGRYLLQDALGHVWKPLGDTQQSQRERCRQRAGRGRLGLFFHQGVRDPEGGIKSLWPIFGIANQLLASIALCLATTILLKMQLARGETGRPLLALITALPLLWLLAVTGTAAVQKVFHPSPRIGFLAAVRTQEEKLATLKESARNEPAQAGLAKKAMRDSRMIAFNSRIDATVTILFLLLVGLVVVLAAREWLLLLSRRRRPICMRTRSAMVPLVGSAPSPLGAARRGRSWDDTA